ncbi:hypothetical protein GCM10011391_39350 [Pullulanibacillus camelliae]|uniref:Uncharacterized protein n=1 Tax=Pullulanibacillus camelliae TaxID=1707096 RepID=A0A8J2YNZ8_9BACL|nr:hypothetical protein [Pullulanibacillus camelliae]GGE56579.1 hypothetical protein GCM10011391_39350 [Pullulanibacillus camelliae]
MISKTDLMKDILYRIRRPLTDKEFEFIKWMSELSEADKHKNKAEIFDFSQYKKEVNE